MTVQTYTSKSRIGTNQLNQVLYCKEAHCRRVALIGVMWVRLIATCWQSLCIFKSDGSYLQTFIISSESDCDQSESDRDCLENVKITWQNRGMVVRSLRVSWHQALAADHLFWTSSRTRSTCLWLLIVIFKGHCSLVRHIVLLWEAAAFTRLCDQSATMFGCAVHGKITSKTQGFPTEHHTLMWWLITSLHLWRILCLVGYQNPGEHLFLVVYFVF